MRFPDGPQARLGLPGLEHAGRQPDEQAAGPLHSRRKQQDFGTKFHRAAMDGYVDMLCEASRRDTNQPAADHHLALTPTLVAAQCGQLDALRILVGRGGDPERATSRGSSALHLAAGRNHLNCVSFLVNFGVNMWALDNELRTAKDVAAIEQSKAALEYLDQMMAKQSAINTKLVQKLKEKAKAAAEKRLKQMRKSQLKAIKQVERDERLLAKMSQGRRLLRSAHSMGDIKLVGRKCVDLGALNLLARCDKEAATTASGQEQTMAGFFQQRRQEDLLAGGRRLRQQQQLSLSAAAASSRSQHPAADDKDTSSTANTSHAPSSAGSTSGYLSSCSARSILKASSSTASSAGNKRSKGESRPRYSDLVAVRCGELREREPPAKDSSSSSASASSVSSGGSLLAAKLRLLGGGVSRKVHLKRLLFAAAANPSERETDERTRELEAPQCRAAALNRARSEPDFGAALRRDEAGSEREAATQETNERQEDESEEAVREGREAGRQARTKTPDGDQQPPQPPPPPPEHEERRQLLLTQCLSQLKLEQRLAIDSEPAAACSRQQFSHSDELLQHQLSAGDFPLRPSVIKHHQLRRQQHQPPPAHCQPGRRRARRATSAESGDEQPSVSAADSIGSVGSFLARNTPPSSGSTNSSASHYHVPMQAGPELARHPHSSACSQASEPVHCGPDARPPVLVDANNNNNPEEELADPKLDDFLARHNLGELRAVLARERIDFEALLLLDEDDLKSLNLLLGPRRKLLNAIERHRAGLLETCRGVAPPLRVHMVDTQF